MLLNYQLKIHFKLIQVKEKYEKDYKLQLIYQKIWDIIYSEQEVFKRDIGFKNFRKY